MKAINDLELHFIGDLKNKSCDLIIIDWNGIINRCHLIRRKFFSYLSIPSIWCAVGVHHSLGQQLLTHLIAEFSSYSNHNDRIVHTTTINRVPLTVYSTNVEIVVSAQHWLGFVTVSSNKMCRGTTVQFACPKQPILLFVLKPEHSHCIFLWVLSTPITFWMQISFNNAYKHTRSTR